MSDTVDKIKERLSILDVVQPYVKLTRAGKYWKGLSPFNKEKTPSFYVSPDRGLYHCFSSGKGGDMFTFVEEMEGVDFKGALKLLAEKAGVEITPQNPGERDMKERLFAALDAARAFFELTLAEKKDAHAYLTGRGVADETITSWTLGYAPKDWQKLRDALSGQGFSDAELERAGLVKRADSADAEKPSNRLYDRFRGRIMFPIRDVSGRVVGFSGRIFEDDEKNPQAKYLNSPETPAFDKSRALYGIEKARDGIRRLGASMLVEGQFDLLMAHQLGYTNAVATSGTAFTAHHAELLKRYAPNLLIAYDGDRAGISAAGRAAAIALPLGMNVKVAKLPPGVDPADCIKENPAVFKEVVKNALHVVDFYLAHLADAKYDPRTFRLEVSRVVLPYVAMIPNQIDRAHFVKKVAEALQVPEEAVTAEVLKVSGGRGQGAGNTQTYNLQPTTSEPFLSRGDTLERLLCGLSLAFKESGDDVLAGKTDAALKSALAPETLKRFEEENDAKRAALFEADLFLERHAEREELLGVMEELFESLRKESAHERYRDTVAALRAAETAHDETRVSALMQELASLAGSLK
ncbi:MAG: DNA primase [Patescibacteria group bacterium]|nr:DNA primase [Patescibacteria group bacterium]